jgi:ribonuclease HI
MSKTKAKVYVVWQGHKPGVYDNWAQTSAQVQGYSGAKYKGFGSLAEANAAFHGEYHEFVGKKTKAAKPTLGEWQRMGVILDAVAVDAACAGVPGDMEYRGVTVDFGEELFHKGPYPEGTNNIGEFLAIVHALSYLQKEHKIHMPIYSDSKTAIAWVRDKRCKTEQPENAANAPIFDLIREAEMWLRYNLVTNPILKWETSEWGEIPADFGRK